jgi:rare lipoprotein A
VVEPRACVLRAAAAALAVALALLSACSTSPRVAPGTGARAGGADGPPAQVPPGLERVPDAVPRIEVQRVGGPNKPYEVLGRRYAPLTGDVEFAEAGLASWYGTRFHGRPTSNGEIYDMFAMTAAHKTLPIPSYVRVSNPANGREVVLRINDRGPFVEGRVIDLSYTAALKLGVLRGVSPVRVVRITHAQIQAQSQSQTQAQAEAEAAERERRRVSELLP